MRAKNARICNIPRHASRIQNRTTEDEIVPFTLHTILMQDQFSAIYPTNPGQRPHLRAGKTENFFLHCDTGIQLSFRRYSGYNEVGGGRGEDMTTGRPSRAAGGGEGEGSARG
jgi:hypothetical protein